MLKMVQTVKMAVMVKMVEEDKMLTYLKVERIFVIKK